MIRHVRANHIFDINALKEKTDYITIIGKPNSSALIASVEVKDQEIIKISKIKMLAIYKLGYTSDSYSFKLNDRVFASDTLLISSAKKQIFKMEIRKNHTQ